MVLLFPLVWVIQLKGEHAELRRVLTKHAFKLG